MAVSMKHSKGWLRKILNLHTDAAQKTPRLQIVEVSDLTPGYLRYQMKVRGNTGELSDTDNYMPCTFTDNSRTKFEQCVLYLPILTVRDNPKRRFTALKWCIIILSRYEVDIEKFCIVVEEFKFVGTVGDVIGEPHSFSRGEKEAFRRRWQESGPVPGLSQGLSLHN